MTMERKIGEIFEYNGEWYQTVEAPIDEHSCNGCQGCKGTGGPRIFGGECNGNARKDNKFVIFKKLEKVGEPMKIHNRLVLKVKADAYKCMRCCFYSKGKCELTMQECEHYDCGEENKFIELKQNKEDMEEKKINLKPFDIQKAREGKPVCTRDGRKARIICFDRISGDDVYKIVACVTAFDGDFEEVLSYRIDGYIVDSQNPKDEDLMMLPEKKEGWVNVYKGIDGVTFSKYPYTSKDEAIKESDILFGRIDTIKVSWEE